jgi:hypothetical protein
MWAIDLGTAACRPSAHLEAGPGMMGTHSTDPVGAGTATEECGR